MDCVQQSARLALGLSKGCRVPLQLLTGLLDRAPPNTSPSQLTMMAEEVCEGLEAVLDKDAKGSSWCPPPLRIQVWSMPVSLAHMHGS